jgi:N-acetylglucosamine-6-phosphate deacetylase
MLITDAMPSVGSAEKSFELQGQKIVVEDGVCLAPDGTLAGSDLDMAGAVRNAMALLDLDLHAAVEMASRNPAAFLGLEQDMGRIAPGCRANLALATDDLEVVETWIDGRRSEES